jgi:eukaryotic-like serine/threonine-protein kinase
MTMLRGQTENRIRLYCTELARRLRAGEACRAEDIFTACPELAGESEIALDLIYTEYLVRSELGEAVTLDEYYRRFPQWREPLYHQFQIHTLLNSHVPSLTDKNQPTPRPPGAIAAGPWKTTPENFEILEEIARGSMGVVYKAWQKNLQRVVALKIILGRALSTPDQLARFRIEGMAISRLMHPNIVQIFKTREWEGCPFLVLEHVEGGTLAKRWNGAPQLPSAVAALIEELARAVEFAHRHGVVHRDLRPGNILLTKEGTPKIIDFGLAKLELHDDKDLTMTGQILGTPSYMAPEQAEGLQQAIGPLVDVYALGAMLYEGLTGRPPFRGQTILDTLQDVGTKEPVPPQRLQPQIPRDLETICLKCLQKDPERRYGSARELAEDLRRFLDRKPILARRVNSAERVWRWCRRNSDVASLLLALVVVAAAAFVLVTWKWRQAVAAHEEAENARIIAQDNEKLAQKERRNAERLSAGLILDQAVSQGDHGNIEHALLLFTKSLEQAVRNEDADLERIARRNLTAFRPLLLRRRAIIPHPDWAWETAFSPNGKFFVTTSKDRAARFWDTETGAAIGDPLWHEDSVWTAAISPDGATLATGSAHPDTGAGEVRIWDVATRQAIGAPLIQHEAIVTVAFGRDSQTLLVLDDAGKAQLWDVKNCQSIGPPLSHASHVVTALFSPDGKLVLTGARDGAARLWQVPDRAPHGPTLSHVQSLNLPPGREVWIVAAAFSPDAQIVATATQVTQMVDQQRRYIGGEVRLWRVETGESLVPPLAHPGPVKTLAFSPDGRLLLTGGFSVDAVLKKRPSVGEARLWDVATGKQIGPTLDHTGPIWTAAFSPSGRLMVTGGEAGYAKFWLTASAQRIGTTYASGNARRVTMSPDGKTAVIGHTYTPAVAELWEIPPAFGTVLAPQHQKKIQALVFSPDERFAASGDDDTARLWDRATAKAHGSPLPHRGGQHTLVFSPDGKLLLTTPEEREAQLWEVASGKAFGPRLKHQGRIVAAAFSDDGRRVLIKDANKDAIWWDVAAGKPSGPALETGSGDGRFVLRTDGKYMAILNHAEFQVWDTVSRKLCELPTNHRDRVTAFAFGPEGRWAASGSEDGAVRIWDLAKGKMQGDILEHSAPVRGAVFNRDGKILLTWSANNNARLWDAATGQPLGPLLQHPDEVTDAVFTPDSQAIIVASGKAVYLWDVATGKRLGPPLRHSDGVIRLACRPDGNLFATAGADRLLRCWEIPQPTSGNVAFVKQWVEALTGRELSDDGAHREIEATVLLQRRRDLEQIGGEPFPCHVAPAKPPR